MSGRYKVTAAHPQNPWDWEQAIVVAADAEDAARVMRERLPESRKDWRITYVGTVSPYADQNGSTHGD